MKKFKGLLCLSLLAVVLLLSSFSLKKKENAGRLPLLKNYAWYTPSGQFVAWSTLLNTEVVTGGDLNPANGTLISEGYTGGGPGQAPIGTVVYKIYSHP
jgi:hypothetical protein